RAFHDHRRGFLPSQVVFPASGGARGAEDDASGRLWGMGSAVEAGFSAERAIHAVLARLGVQPGRGTGHSTGADPALLAAGAPLVEDDAEVVAHVLEGNRVTERSIQAGLVPAGTLLVVGPANSAEVRSAINRLNGSIHVAMDNCPNQVVLCGSDQVVDS